MLNQFFYKLIQFNDSQNHSHLFIIHLLFQLFKHINELFKMEHQGHQLLQVKYIGFSLIALLLFYLISLVEDKPFL